MEERLRWIELIKAVREEHGVSIDEAHEIVSTRPEWRRWVERQINSDPQCRRMALYHLKSRGPAAMIVQEGELLKVR